MILIFVNEFCYSWINCNRNEKKQQKFFFILRPLSSCGGLLCCIGVLLCIRNIIFFFLSLMCSTVVVSHIWYLKIKLYLSFVFAEFLTLKLTLHIYIKKHLRINKLFVLFKMWLFSNLFLFVFVIGPFLHHCPCVRPKATAWYSQFRGELHKGTISCDAVKHNLHICRFCLIDAHNDRVNVCWQLKVLCISRSTSYITVRHPGLFSSYLLLSDFKFFFNFFFFFY